MEVKALLGMNAQYEEHTIFTCLNNLESPGVAQ